MAKFFKSLSTRFSRRLDRANASYRFYMDHAGQKHKTIAMPPKKAVCGWLVPQEEEVVCQKCELYEGVNILRTTAPKDQEIPRIEMSAQGTLLKEKQGSRPVFHGEELMIEGKKYSFYSLYTRQFTEIILRIVFAMIISGSYSEIAIGQNTVGDIVEVDFDHLGPVKSMEFIDPPFPIRIVGFSPIPTYDVFLIDTGSSCVTRQFEGLIHKEISQILQAAHPHSVVSIVEFSRVEQTSKQIFRRLHVHQPPESLIAEKSLFKCSEASRSVNAVEALMLQQDLILDSRSESMRRRVILFTSGNVAELDDDRPLLASGDQLHVIAYSPVQLAYVESAFQHIFAEGLNFTWWPKAEPLNLIQTMSIRYLFRSLDGLPADTQAVYTVKMKINNDEKDQLLVGLEYLPDEDRARLENNLWIAGGILFALFVFAFCWKVVRSLRRPICRETRLSMSRFWTRSMHIKKDEQLWLHFQLGDGQYFTKPMDVKTLTIGELSSDDIRLPKIFCQRRIRLSQESPGQILLESLDQKPLRVDTEEQGLKLKLRNRAIIDLGLSTCQIIFQSTEQS